ncbi:hypothetical protein A9G29_07935 [Gilliamella sp. Fer2-1]|nr:hypothetical protein A9G29_07935 [Gilliamella apicola]
MIALNSLSESSYHSAISAVTLTLGLVCQIDEIMNISYFFLAVLTVVATNCMHQMILLHKHVQNTPLLY